MVGPDAQGNDTASKNVAVARTARPGPKGGRLGPPRPRACVQETQAGCWAWAAVIRRRPVRPCVQFSTMLLQ